MAQLTKQEREERFKKEVDQFNAKWMKTGGDPISSRGPKRPQVCRAIQAKLSEVFGRDFTVGIYPEQALGNAEGIGYQVLTVGDFPVGLDNKPTWSDAIATRHHVFNAVDGTIRWGSRRECYVCVIDNDSRQRHLKRREELEAERAGRIFKTEAKTDKEMAENPDVTETEAGVTKEKLRPPVNTITE